MTASYQYTSFIWPMLTGAGLGTLIGIYCCRHKNVPGAKGLAFIMLFMVVRLIANALGMTAADFSTKVFWFQIEEICLLPATVAGLAFAMEYAGLDAWLNRRTISLIAFPTLFFIPLCFTNDAHHLIWTRLWWEGNIRYVPGVLNYAMMGYGLVLSLVTLSILIGLFIRSPLQRWPIGLIFLNMLGSRILYFLNAAGLNPVRPFDPTDLATNFICAIYFVALFRFRLFDVVPVARNRAIEQMRDGMLVLDAENRIADLNRAAQALIGASGPKVIGRSAREVMGEHTDLLELVLQPAARHGEIWLDSSRCYQVNVTPLVSRANYGLGKLILLSDISERKRAQKQLQDQELKLSSLKEREWLARELHDGLGQLLAAADLQVKTASECHARGQTAGIGTCLKQLAEVIGEGKAHVGDYLFGVKKWSSSDRFFTSLRRYLVSYSQKNHVRTELVVPPEVENNPPGAVVETQLQRIIQEAMMNIRKHAGADSVRVVFSRNGALVETLIEDDGRGFETDMIGDGGGFGLRAMRGRAESLGAGFEVKSSPGNGTQVIVRVPWQEEDR
jgi:PAS domain S-box-containing protein